MLAFLNNAFLPSAEAAHHAAAARLSLRAGGSSIPHCLLLKLCLILLLPLPPPLLLLLLLPPEFLHPLVAPADHSRAGPSEAAGCLRAAGLCQWRLCAA
jgi:hypothetical protein